jgi:hypothetical protein
VTVVGLAVMAALLTAGAISWPPAGQETVIGTDVVLAVLLSPILPGTLLLALAGVAIPTVSASPGPVRWVLVHSGWAIGGGVPVTLELLWLSYQPDDWTRFQAWYGSAAWLSGVVGLLFLVACGWWLARRTFQAGPGHAASRLVRVRGYAVAALIGAGCPLWWFAAAAPLHLHNRCVWSTAENSACDAGAAVWRTGGLSVPLGWLYVALGAFILLSLVGLLAAVLRILFADRVRTRRSLLIRIGVGLLGLSAAGLAYLSVDSHRVAVGQSSMPWISVVRAVQAPAITSDPTATVAAVILFVPLLALAIAVQAVRRRPAGSAGQ